MIITIDRSQTAIDLKFFLKSAYPHTCAHMRTGKIGRRGGAGRGGAADQRSDRRGGAA